MTYGVSLRRRERETHEDRATGVLQNYRQKFVEAEAEFRNKEEGSVGKFPGG